MENIYQHFRKEEREFIDTALDWIRRVEFEYSPYLTDFLDPRQSYIVENLAGQSDEVSLYKFGGVENAERSRVFLAPSYYEPERTDYEISVLEIHYPVKFQELNHGQILGTLIGMGLKREKIGDILSDGERWQIVVDEKIESFVLTQMERVGKTKVSLSTVSEQEILSVKDEWENKTVIVSSLRLDTFISSVLNLSREKAKTLIQSKRVKINWMETSSLNEEVQMGDVLSVRGFGRIKFSKLESRTKKDKYVIEAGLLKAGR